MNPPLRLLTKLLAGIGVLALVAIAAGVALSNWPDTPDIEVMSKAESPDGGLTAIAATYMSGGAPGSCRNVVIIRESTRLQLPSSYRAVEAEAVFTSRCQSGISLSWLSNSKVRVGFTVPPGRSGTEATFQQLHPTLPVEVVHAVEA